ncbi:polysaccharide deacetylase family protein [Pelosinus sp. sgz500959]|uniref:polysaccharide deacetylase family protein n=1 Tax=Pelosinus sp. sgz500959 TaxID=3242472 RepID=UPI00366D0A9F
MRSSRFLGVVFSAVIAAAVLTQGITSDQEKVIKKVPTTHKVVALTVDDGPHYKTTPQMLAILREKKVKLTLFILGENAKSHPEILAQAVADGHEIANHAYSHQLLSKMSKDDVQKELNQAEKVITAVAPMPTLFRPPGGAYNHYVLEESAKHGYTTILWSIDPGDWRRPSVESVVDEVMKKIEPGSIVLLHDGQYPLPTPEAIGIIIDRLREQGYSIVTVSELLQYYEVRP